MIQFHSISQGKYELIYVKGFIYNQLVKLLIDGAASHYFISKRFIDRHQLHDKLKNEISIIEMGNGTSNESSTYGDFAYSIQSFSDTTTFYVNKLSCHHNAIFGKSWLYNHQPHIDWWQNIVTLPDKEDITEPVKKPITIICWKELNQLLCKNKLEGYTIIFKPTMITDATNTSNASSPIDQLIDSYNNCFPDDIPPGLLPEWHVDHMIPLMLIYKLPKQWLYQLSAFEMS